MLTDEQQFVLALLRSAMGIAPALTPTAQLDAATVAIAVRRQGIVLTVYPQLTALPQAQQMFTAEYYAAVSQAVTKTTRARAFSKPCLVQTWNA